MKQPFLKQELTSRLSSHDGKCKLGSSTEVILCESNEEAISRFLEDPTIFLLYQEVHTGVNQQPKLRSVAYKLLKEPKTPEQLDLALLVHDLAAKACWLDNYEIVASCLTENRKPAETKQLEHLERFTNELQLIMNLKDKYTELGAKFRSDSEPKVVNVEPEGKLALTTVLHTLPFPEYEKIQSTRMSGDS